MIALEQRHRARDVELAAECVRQLRPRAESNHAGASREDRQPCAARDQQSQAHERSASQMIVAARTSVAFDAVDRPGGWTVSSAREPI